MPTYEYECSHCGIFEVEQKISEPALTLCPECEKSKGSQPVKRIISAPSFHLKGGGWYKDLYSSTQKKSDAPKEAKTESLATTKETTPSKPKGAKPNGGCGSGSCGCA